MPEIIKGGFALSEADEKLVNHQRKITSDVNSGFIQVGAVFLQMSGKNPYESDWFRRKFRDTNLQEWIDNPRMRDLNLGFNLQFGWLDMDMDSEDPRYNECIVKAIKFLGIDSRFSFGRQSKGVPSHVLVQLYDADQANYDDLKKFEPKGFRVDGKFFKCELRSMAPLPDNAQANTIKESRQTVMPGSIYVHKLKSGEYDLSVWYGPDGKVATHISEIASTTSRKVEFSRLITAIAFGTFLYVIQPHWQEGGRQALANKIAGFLARVVRDSKAVNDGEHTSQSTFCPLSTPEMAESLIDFICADMGDIEAFMRKRTFRDAMKKLEANPDAKIPGWVVLEATVGIESKIALQTVLMPGVDVSPLTVLGDTFLYDETSDAFIDRDFFRAGADKFVFDGSALDRRYRNVFIELGGKQKPIWKVFEQSKLRRNVSISLCNPDLPQGIVYRQARSGTILNEDQESAPGDGSITIYNTWRGWPISPAVNPNPELLKECMDKWNKMAGYLCQDNKVQVGWLWKWVAHTVKEPGQKQQIAPIFVGGQGVGKSFFSDYFLGKLFGNLYGQASPKVLEGDFSVEPFLNKMFVFMDEAKIYTERAQDEVKKIIRATSLPGAVKYESSRTHPIYARMIFASNRFDMNMGMSNDRAIYFIKTYDQDFVGKTANGFKSWVQTLKPFYEEYFAFMDRLDVKEHYMYLLMNTEVSREEIEDNSTSSANDSHIVESNMSNPKRIAKYILENDRIFEDIGIEEPFPIEELYKRIIDTCDMTGLRLRNRDDIFNEFKSADLVEWTLFKGRKLLRFKYRVGTLVDLFGDHIGMKFECNHTLSEQDYGENKCQMGEGKPWRGRTNRFGI